MQFFCSHWVIYSSQSSFIRVFNVFPDIYFSNLNSNNAANDFRKVLLATTPFICVRQIREYKFEALPTYKTRCFDCSTSTKLKTGFSIPSNKGNEDSGFKSHM